VVKSTCSCNLFDVGGQGGARLHQKRGGMKEGEGVPKQKSTNTAACVRYRGGERVRYQAKKTCLLVKGTLGKGTLPQGDGKVPRGVGMEG